MRGKRVFVCFYGRMLYICCSYVEVLVKLERISKSGRKAWGYSLQSVMSWVSGLFIWFCGCDCRFSVVYGYNEATYFNN